MLDNVIVYIVCGNVGMLYHITLLSKGLLSLNRLQVP